MIQSGSHLWQYLPPDQRQLAGDGRMLIEDRRIHPHEDLSDFSYIVFPFAKLYEGFLKNVFRDTGIITDKAYRSTHFRIGKALSPNLIKRLGNHSAYGRISREYGEDMALSLWTTWKQGRNLVFHYFPGNIRRLTFSEACDMVDQMINVMEKAVRVTGVFGRKRQRDQVYTGTSA